VTLQVKGALTHSGTTPDKHPSRKNKINTKKLLDFADIASV
jgi:hypothetical protein